MSHKEKIMGTKNKEKEKSIVRSELNLEKNPVFTVSSYKKKSREIVLRETSPEGEITERRIIIGKTAQGVETGVLNTSHFKVYLALLELWDKAGRPVLEPVHFTILRVLKRLGMKDSGEEYRRLKRWLRDLRQIPISFIQSFYIPKKGEYRDLSDITILNHLRIYERKEIGRQKKIRGYGEFRFDDYIIEGLINNYVHPLRLDVIKSFKKHKDLAILLYTFIDRNLAFKDEFEIGLERLFEILDLSQKHVRKPYDRKKVLDPVVKELQGKELSIGVLSYIRILKTMNDKDYKLVCHKKPFFPPKDNGKKEALVQEMIEVLGDEKSRAFYQLVAEKCPEDLIYRCLSEVKDSYLTGSLKKNKGAYFIFLIKKYVRERGIGI